jgi:hypothetical protein
MPEKAQETHGQSSISHIGIAYKAYKDNEKYIRNAKELKEVCAYNPDMSIALTYIQLHETLIQTGNKRSTALKASTRSIRDQKKSAAMKNALTQSHSAHPVKEVAQAQTDITKLLEEGGIPKASERLSVSHL